MESFNNNLQGGKKLVKSLEKQSPVSCLQAPSTPAVVSGMAGLPLEEGGAYVGTNASTQQRVIMPVAE